MSEHLNFNYAGFWKRLGAFALDGLIVIPSTIISAYFTIQYRWGQALTTVPTFAFAIFYWIYLMKTFGGTPGMRLMSLRVRLSSGEAITWKTAILRHTVPLGFALLAILGSIYAVAMLTDDPWASGPLMFGPGFFEGLRERSRGLAAVYAASPIHFVSYIMSVWIYGDIFVVLTNKRRRGLDDFVAGTIVLDEKKPRAPAVAEVAAAL